MSDKTLYKIAGISAILATLLILVGNLGGGFFEAAPGLSSFDPEEALTAVSATPNVVLFNGWLNIYGALFSIVATIGIFRLVRDAGSHVLIPTIIMLIGLVLLTLAYLVMMASVYQLGPLFVAGAPREELFGAEYLRKILFEVIVVYSSWLTLGVSMALFGLFGLWSANVPKWISWVALIGGVIGSFEWLKAYPWQADRIILTLVNLAAFGVWFIAIGVVMLRHKE